MLLRLFLLYILGVTEFKFGIIGSILLMGACTIYPVVLFWGIGVDALGTFCTATANQALDFIFIRRYCCEFVDT
jgi:O-antigen/teichoic acid export membrane protein